MTRKGKILAGGAAALLLFAVVKKKSSIAVNALALIKKFEGLRLKAYDDGTGVWTIGYGTTKGVKPGQTITQAQAEQFLLRDAAEKVAAIKKYIKVPLTQNQFAAVLSLVYNIGEGAFQKSTLLKKINAKAPLSEIEPQFLAWRNAGGKPILLGRRIEEFNIYKS